MLRTAGIHHITAFVGHPQRNLDFYGGVLGLRLVKKTINFDAPEVYHLYFGNEQGDPGTIITFFPWEGARKGIVGAGQVGITKYAVPIGAYDFWKQRLQRLQVPFEEHQRFGEQYLQFADPDGLVLAIVERAEGTESAWSIAGITPNSAIKGFDGAVLYSHAPKNTAHTLEHVLGLTFVGEDQGFARFKAHGDIANIIDVNMNPMNEGIGGAGTVHHIAWRTTDVEEQGKWRNVVSQAGFSPTPIVDRQYFTAIYFREEGGILFEIATDPPGFTTDEEFAHLGEKLMLPAWYEHHREQLTQLLTPIALKLPKEDE